MKVCINSGIEGTYQPLAVISSINRLIVKRFRKRTGILTPTIADITSTLDRVTNVVMDDIPLRSIRNTTINTTIRS